MAPAFAWSAPAYFSYQGQIIKPNGQALEANNVQFQIEILSPEPELCVLYEESHTLNMTNSNGIFAITVGEGTRPGDGSFQDLSTLSNSLNNFTGVQSPDDCVAGPTYTPDPSDGRKLRITFDDGSGPVTLAQDHNVVSVPYAANAASVSGITASELLRINNGTGFNLTQSNLDFVFNDSNWAELQALLDGSSASFGGGLPSSDVDNNNQKIVNLDDPNPAADNDAVNVRHARSYIGGRAVDTTNIGSLAGGVDVGKVISWDGTQWITSVVDDTTKLPTAGGTMSGAINMGNQNISNANDLTANNDISAGNNLTVGGGIGVTTGINSAGDINLANESEVQFSEATGNGTNYLSLKAPAALATNVLLTLPPNDGDPGQYLQTDGSGVLTWQNVNAGVTQVFGRSGNVVATAGDYDADQVSFDNTYGGDVDTATEVQGAIEELSTEKVATSGDSMTGNLVMDLNGGVTTELRFQDTGTKYVGFQAPNTVSAVSSFVWTLPDDDGGAGQVLQTSGAGILSWASVASESRTVTAGQGLTGGGDLSANRTFDIGAGNGITVNADDIEVQGGSGILVDGSGVNVDIAGTADEALVEATDSILIRDNSDSGNLKEMTRANFVLSQSEVGTFAGNEGFLQNITGTELDNVWSGNGILVRTGVGTYSAITDNSSNWDQAFAWGDHSAAGYLTSETQSLDDAYNNGSAINVDTTDVVFDLTSTNNFQIQDGGNPSFIVTDTGDVGIGTTAPTTKLHIAGNITSPGAGTQSEIFGFGASGTANESIAFGYNASSSGGGTGQIALGYGASAGGAGAISIGHSSSATPNDVIAIGRGSSASGAYAQSIGSYSTADAENIAIGAYTQALGNNNSNVALGYGSLASGAESIAIKATSAHNSSVAINRDSTAPNQFVVGYVTDVHFNGVMDSAPSSYTIHGVSGSGGDISGGNIQIAGGRSTGAGTGGSILLSTAPAGVSGTTTNSLVERLRVTGSGNVGIGTTTPNSKLQISGGVQIGDDLAACDGTKEGTLKYVGNVVSFCDGTSWEAFGTASGGEVNTASNVGAGTQIFKQKTGTDFEFRTLGSANSKIGVSTVGDVVTLTIDESSFTPTAIPIGTTPLTATTLQAAIVELEGDKVSNSRSILSGNGLTGGGDLTADRTLAVQGGDAITVDGTGVHVDITNETAEASVAAGDELLIYDTSVGALRKMTRSNFVLSNAEVEAIIADDGYVIDGGNAPTGSLDVGTTNAQDLTFLTNNSTAMTIDTSGNVGIGTINPGKLLHVHGTSEFESTMYMRGSAPTIRFYDTSWADFSDHFRWRGGANGESFDLQWWDDSAAIMTDILTANSSGNIGIGSSTPAAKLDVAGQILVGGEKMAPTVYETVVVGERSQSDGVASLALTPSASSGKGFKLDVKDDGVDNWFAVYDMFNDAHRLVVEDTGRVGINTVNPAVELDVHTGTINAAAICDENNSNCLDLSTGVGGSSLWTDNAGDISYVSGNVGVGTTSPTYKIHSFSDVDQPSFIGVENSNAGVSAVSGMAVVNDTGSAGAGVGFVSVYGSNHTEASMRNNTLVGANDDLSFSSGVSRDIKFFTNVSTLTAADQKMILTSAGDLGIGTSAPGSTLDINGAETMRGIAAPALSPAGQGRIYFDSTSNTYKVSQNGSAYTDLVGGGGGGSGDFMADGSVPMSDQFLSVLGNAGAPGMTFDGDTDTGVFSPGANSLAFTNAGSESVRIDATGNVGIGTTNPSSSLHVGGPTAPQLKVQENGSSYSAILSNSGNSSRLYTSSGTTSFLYFDAPSGGSSISQIGFHRYGTSGTGARLVSFYRGNGTSTIDHQIESGISGETYFAANGGNVGIGTTAPEAILDVAGTGALLMPRGLTGERPGVAVNGMIRYNSTNNKVEVYENSTWAEVATGAAGTGDLSNGGNTGAVVVGSNDNTLVLESNNTPALSFDTSQNATHSGALNIQMNGDNDMLIFDDTSGTADDVSMRNNGINFFVDHVQSPKDLFGFNLSSGNVKVGTAVGTTARMTIHERSGNPSDIRFTNIDTGETSADGTKIGIDASENAFINQEENLDFWIGTNDIERFRILASGNVGIGTTAPGSTLDVAGTIRAQQICDETGSNCQDISTGWASGTGDFLADGSVPMTGDLQLDQRILGGNPGNRIVTGTGAGHELSIQTSDANLRLRTINNNDIYFITNSNERMRILQTGDVGIGTTAPGSTLDINGAESMRGITAPALSPAGQGRIYFDSTSNTYKVSQNGSAYTDLVGGGGGSGDFMADGSVPMTNQFLSVLGNAGAPGITFDGDTDTGVFRPALNSIAFTNAGSESVRIDASGKVGIGTTAPNSQLEVVRSPASTSGSDSSFLAQTTPIPSSIATTEFRSVAGIATKENNSNMSGAKLTGSIGIAAQEGTGDLLEATGVAGEANINSSGAGVASLLGGRFTVNHGSMTGATVTSAIGGRFDVNNSGTGMTAVGYGVYIDDVEALSSYGVYQAGSDDYNYFAGSVGIGTTIPARRLHVFGAARIEPTALPGTPGAGDVAIDSADSNKLKYYDGTAWVEAGGSGGGGTITSASNVSNVLGVGLFKQENAGDLEFKSLDAGSSKISIVGGTSDVTLDIAEGNIVHDNLSGFVANEHIDHSGVSLTAGAGLTGGGDISASRSFAVGAGAGIIVNANDVAVNISGTTATAAQDGADSLLVHDNSAGALRRITTSNFLSGYLQASIGTTAGDVMGADAVPHCDPDQKLEMTDGPTYLWSCVPDLGGSVSSLDAADGAPTSVVSVDNDGIIVIGQGEGGTPLDTKIRGPQASGNDIAGGDITIEASNGTGGGGSGAIIFNTSGPSAVPINPETDSNSSQTSAAVSVETWSHTTGSGSDRLLLVGVAVDNSTAVSSVTYNSLPLTKLDHQSASVRAELWYLVNPPSGTYNITVTMASTVRFTTGAVSLSGVHQGTPFGTLQKSSGSGNSNSVTVSSASDEYVVDILASSGAYISNTHGPGQTRYFTRSHGNGGGAMSIESGAASVAMSWTRTSPRSWSQIAVPIKPANPGASALPGDSNTIEERVRITPTGYVGIGTSSPDEILTVYNGSTFGRYTSSGWTHSSDRRLKENIEPLPTSLEKLLKLKPVSYKYRTDREGKQQIGFIAQDVEPLFPEVVETDDEGLKSMIYSNLIAPVVQAIQELNTKIDKLFAAQEKETKEVERLKRDLAHQKDEHEKEVKRLQDKNDQLEKRLEAIEKLIHGKAQ